MASLNALNTVALLGYSLPDWVGYMLLAFVFLGAFFALPRIIKYLL